MAGDQQASNIGQACFTPGMVKVTYGTGCFMLLNTGTKVVQSHSRLLSTIAYRLKNQTTYCLEGSIFSAGSTIRWLRDKLNIISSAQETEKIAEHTPNTGGVYLVPAFTGLGAPYWDPHARGAFFGLTRNTDRHHLVRAALESVGYQTRDLLEAMVKDYQGELSTLRVDGEMANNNWLMQFISDILHLEIQRPKCIETTALGVAFLAGLQIGIYQSLEDITALWQSNSEFLPKMSEHARKHLYQGWQGCVARVLS